MSETKERLTAAQARERLLSLGWQPQPYRVWGGWTIEAWASPGGGLYTAAEAAERVGIEVSAEESQ